MKNARHLPLRSVVAISLAFTVGPSLLTAQTPPGEVTGFDLDGSSTLTWDAAPQATDYNVYRGLLSWLDTQEGAACHGDEVAGLSFPTPSDPAQGEGYYYLVTGEAAGGIEGSAGIGSLGSDRVLRGRCDPVMRNHLLSRVGYGWNEYAADRVVATGLSGFLNEQLDPASIDESTNTPLNTRVAAFVPPDNIQELMALDVVRAVYARRQLEQQVTMFWDNHFNTDYRASFQFFNFYQALFPLNQLRESAKFHYDNEEVWRAQAFSGSFREMVETMSLSPAMILYLDTVLNVNTVPNENFPRELLELHTMGVDGGYVQQDVVELARVFTGWNVCKKDAAVAGDPLSVCIPRNLYGTAGEPPGLFVNNFRVNLHDTGQKVLFAGTPYQAIIPSTAGNPAAGVSDVALALDAILAHPATSRFIAKKLLQRFVTETPSQAMLDAVVAEWNDAGNPAGTGDLREVLRAVLNQTEFLDPDYAGGKIKTPFEHVVSGIRAIRGTTDGSNIVRTYLQRMQEQFHFNPVPTGYSEIGADWLDTNNLLERQNFGLDAATRTSGALVGNIIGMLNENGVSTAAAPNNAAAIVDFMADAMFGGALTPSERQRAIDYLDTDDNGIPSIYDDARIRETAGFMLGFAQFLEQ